MARKIIWKDLAVLARFKNQKLVLDNSFQYVYNPGLFSSSLLSLVLSAGGFYTAVEQPNSEETSLFVGQLFQPPGNVSARVVFLAPGNLDPHPAFGRVFSQLANAAGERGALQIKAEVKDNSPGEEILYLAGFRPYAEQQIWKLPRRIVFGTGKKAWIPVTKDTSALAESFYQRILPGQIQRVEPPPVSPDIQGLISWKDGKVVGFAAAQFGPKGILVDLLMAPEIDLVDEYLSALLFHLPYRDSRDVYLRVRSYQQQLASALERVEAQAGPKQKAVVRRLTVHYNAKQTFRVQGFEKQPDITTPISNSEIKN
ncbi:MAG: hypothetical protein DRJ13_14455 [Bacteroidetes bacterium]|nr:MAG: hypothetical protein DRJ13_14455 [Bacteroidota bacterium]